MHGARSAGASWSIWQKLMRVHESHDQTTSNHKILRKSIRVVKTNYIINYMFIRTSFWCLSKLYELIDDDFLKAHPISWSNRSWRPMATSSPISSDPPLTSAPTSCDISVSSSNLPLGSGLLKNELALCGERRLECKNADWFGLMRACTISNVYTMHLCRNDIFIRLFITALQWLAIAQGPKIS